MLSDRAYMRGDYARPPTSILTWILSVLFAGFVVQNIAGRWFGSSAFENLLALTPTAVLHGRVWTLLTYPLLHGGILQLLFNLLGIFFLGRELVPLVGNQRFLALFLACASVGGLVWAAVHYFTGGGELIGATGCVTGLFILFACFYPNREITFYLFFVLPVTLKPKFVAWLLVALDGLGFLFSEIPGKAFDSGVAHSSHVGAMLVGWIYYRYLHANNGWDRAASFSWPAWLRRRKPQGAVAGPYKLNVGGSTVDFRAEVDRILDKINSQGFGALTDEEKRILDEAKDLLSRH